MVQSSADSNLLGLVIKQDFRALYTSMRLLLLCLIYPKELLDPKNKNATAIRRMLKFPLSENDLITELKDPKSQAHKYFFELMITFANLLENRHIIYLHEQIQKELKQRALDEDDDEYAERIHQLWLDSIRSVQLRDAQLLELLEKKNLSEYQALLLKKMYELLFYLGCTSNKQSLKILFSFFTDFYQRREDNEVVVRDLQQQLDGSNISDQRRQWIIRTIDNYRTFQQAYNAERRQRLFSGVLNDPIALQQRVNEMIELEKQATAELNKEYDKVMNIIDVKNQLIINNSLIQITKQLTDESSGNNSRLNKNQLALLLRDIWSNPSLMDFNNEILSKMLSVLSVLSAVRSEFDDSNIAKLRENLRQLIVMMAYKEAFKDIIPTLENWADNCLPSDNSKPEAPSAAVSEQHSEVNNPEVVPLEEIANNSVNNEDVKQDEQQNISDQSVAINVEPIGNDQFITDYDLQIINELREELHHRMDNLLEGSDHHYIQLFIQSLDEITGIHVCQKELMNGLSDRLTERFNDLAINSPKDFDLSKINNLIKQLSFINPYKLQIITTPESRSDFEP